ncbi:MAG: hypothetical protein ACRED7_11845 [Stellaceae bacterium]
MRCYFMQRNEIWAVEFLKSTDSRLAVKRAMALFIERYSEKSDGFEIWDGDHCIFHYQSAEYRAIQ